MAGDPWTVTSDGGSSIPRTARALAKATQQHPKLKFKILAGVGSEDGTSGSIELQIRAM